MCGGLASSDWIDCRLEYFYKKCKNDLDLKLGETRYSSRRLGQSAFLYAWGMHLRLNDILGGMKAFCSSF